MNAQASGAEFLFQVVPGRSPWLRLNSNRGHKAKTVSSDLCFDRNRVQWLRNKAVKRADRSSENDQRDSISDAAMPHCGYHHTVNPHGQPVRHILFGMGDQRKDGYGVIYHPRGAGGGHTWGGLFFRREEPSEFARRRDREEDEQAEKLNALANILSNFGLGRQDIELIVRLIELEIVENPAKPRKLGCKKESLSPVLTRFVANGMDISTWWHNFFAKSPEEVRSPSTIAEWERRRSDVREDGGRLRKMPNGLFRYIEKSDRVKQNGEFFVVVKHLKPSLWREFAEIFGVHLNLNVFPSEKVSLILARIAMLHDEEMAKRLSVDIDRFLHPPDLWEHLIADSGQRKPDAHKSNPFHLIRESPFYYSEGGWHLGIFPKDQRTSVGRNVPRPSDMQVEAGDKDSENLAVSRIISEGEREEALRVWKARRELFRISVPCTGLFSSRPTLQSSNL